MGSQFPRGLVFNMSFSARRSVSCLSIFRFQLHVSLLYGDVLNI